ncbi:radical SAM protein [Stygiolobus caldivivus]|uniref:Radical SAM protein n=1 Tax=Stygiolobus caldivivus TaxID=2824673 RepID=A0A8D5U4P3_9CREN|nr:radical SAM protein [Stygiolobus caldivivus]BCU69207.1 radical SAM protein [Stygiolobus caldivivus]
MLRGNPDIGVYNALPRGCELCRLGGKLVVYITGECGDNCYYCPVSTERFGKDVMYANEAEVKSLYDFIYEAYRMNAAGAGITGGDPILAIGRLTKLIRLFKDEFSSDFHVHLYTSGRYVTNDVLRELERVGLDEIRFHPVKEDYLKAVEKALKFRFDVGIEVPSIPHEKEFLERIVEWGVKKGVKFININELELTERNYQSLNVQGYRVSHGLTGVKGSAELALSLLRKYESKNVALHYCSSVYKDVVETRTRFLRIIKYSAKPYENGTPEGTIVRAIVKSNSDLSDIGEKIGEGMWSISPDFSSHFSEVVLVEEHPDQRRLRITEKLINSKT